MYVPMCVYICTHFHLSLVVRYFIGRLPKYQELGSQVVG